MPATPAAVWAYLTAAIDFELARPGEPSVPISDPDDQPILDAAVTAAVDVIVTGDNDRGCLAVEAAPLDLAATSWIL